MVSLGRTKLDVYPICLGGNVFGWTADEEQSREVLDAYTAAGGNFIDTANSYLLEHGRSETILGRWLKDRGNRDEIVLATKVGGGRDPHSNLRADNIRSEAHASLERLQTDYIDLYYAHRDDPNAPLEESLRAFDALVKEGVVRHVAASNYSAERLTAALELQRELGLAAGFLTGKYRPGGAEVASPRAQRARDYLAKGGAAALDALDQVAAAHQVPVTAVALAWLLTRPHVAAPLASARTTEQLGEILPAATLELTPEETGLLTVSTAEPA